MALAFMSWVRIDLMGFLFGDILAVSTTDILAIYAGGVFVLVVLAAIWTPLFAATVNRELAEAEGRRPDRANLVFMILLATVIAISMKIVGVLLITAMLIIPAATARRLSGGPEQMAVLAAVIGVVAVIGGLFGSLEWDTPSGPSERGCGAGPVSPEPQSAGRDDCGNEARRSGRENGRRETMNVSHQMPAGLTRNQSLVLSGPVTGQRRRSAPTRSSTSCGRRAFGHLPRSTARSTSWLKWGPCTGWKASMPSFACRHPDCDGHETVAFAICDTCGMVAELSDDDLAHHLKGLAKKPGSS